MGNNNSTIPKDAPFLFMVDDGDACASGLVAYGGPLRTSLGSPEVESGAASCASSMMKWMAIYSEDGSEPEQHALVWHTACFAF